MNCMQDTIGFGQRRAFKSLVVLGIALGLLAGLLLSQPRTRLGLALLVNNEEEEAPQRGEGEDSEVSVLESSPRNRDRGHSRVSFVPHRPAWTCRPPATLPVCVATGLPARLNGVGSQLRC